MSGAMRKGERTRKSIVEKSAPVFNTKGYFGTSMSDLVRETGLQKGGIYNHFSGKEELALEVFDHAINIMRARFRSALEEREGTIERLFAVIDVLSDLVDNPPVAGGCPILNTAVESDDTTPELKERARGAMTDWQRLIGSITKRGVQSGELPPETDPYEMASVVTATLEGAVMLSRLYDDPTHMSRAVGHLKEYLSSLDRSAGTKKGEA